MTLCFDQIWIAFLKLCEAKKDCSLPGTELDEVLFKKHPSFKNDIESKHKQTSLLGVIY